MPPVRPPSRFMMRARSSSACTSTAVEVLATLSLLHAHLKMLMTKLLKGIDIIVAFDLIIAYDLIFFRLIVG
jgi:hypothetical protein